MSLVLLNKLYTFYIGIFKTLSIIYDGAFHENNQRLKPVSYFLKALHL